MGPIQVFILGFEDFRATGGIAAELIALSDARIARIVDARVLVKQSKDVVVAARMSDLENSEREELRAAAGALVGLGAEAVLGGHQEGAVAGIVLGADAALGVGELGMTAADIDELVAELEVGDAVLLLVIENSWASGLANSIRDSGVVFGQQDYMSADGLVALGALLGVEVALER
ncbi:MAG: hypothetical protein ACR2QO_17450 [Acidimicrobiales bacterium]